MTGPADFRVREPALLLRIILDENIRVPPAGTEATGRKGLAWQAVLEHLRESGAWGATVMRGMAGFGPTGDTHRASLVDRNQHLPLIIEAIDRSEKIEAILDDILLLVPDGVITTRPVEAHRRILAQE